MSPDRTCIKPRVKFFFFTSPNPLLRQPLPQSFHSPHSSRPQVEICSSPSPSPPLTGCFSSLVLIAACSSVAVHLSLFTAARPSPLVPRRSSVAPHLAAHCFPFTVDRRSSLPLRHPCFGVLVSMVWFEFWLLFFSHFPLRTSVNFLQGHDAAHHRGAALPCFVVLFGIS